MIYIMHSTEIALQGYQSKTDSKKIMLHYVTKQKKIKEYIQFCVFSFLSFNSHQDFYIRRITISFLLRQKKQRNFTPQNVVTQLFDPLNSLFNPFLRLRTLTFLTNRTKNKFLYFLFT